MLIFWSKAVMMKKSEVKKESLPTITQETTQKCDYKLRNQPQSSTETPPFTTNTAAPTPVQEEVKNSTPKTIW